MESLITDDGKYRIESLSAATLEGSLKVMRDDFFQDENVCTGVGLGKDPVAIEEMIELSADAALDGLSLVAVEIASGEVVAVAFNKLQVAPSESSGKSFFETFIEERCKRPKSRAVIDFMVDVDAKCNHFERYGIDSLVELLFLGTCREHRQKGLAKLLCKTSIEVAKKLKDGPITPLKVEDLGPKYAFMKPRKPITKVPKLFTSMWTADGTKKIGKDLGFEVLVTVSLKDYFFEGKRFSDGLGFVTTCEGAAIKI
ncbi:hypothetical protein SFRURICE_002627 [Spodoptera frugiperda]|nr:hypothetical protein SFRURICE_002627 [Spodoptera frugiperda]